MGEDKLSEYVDLEAVGQQTTQFLALLDKLENKFNTLNGIKLSLDGLSKTKDVVNGANAASAAIAEMGETVEEVKVINEQYVKASKEFIAASTQQAKSNNATAQSFDALIKQQVENQRAGKELTKQKKELDKAFQDGLISNKQYQESLERIAKEEVALKVSNNDLARALRNMEKEAQAADGSLNELRAKLNLALQAYDRLSAAEKNSDVGKGVKANIDVLTKAISQQEESTGRFQRNVGNYSGALKTLEGSLTGVKKKIEDYTASGQTNADTLAMLQKEQKLLEQLVNTQISGFASATTEIKANTVALQQLSAAGMENTETYKQLFAQTAALKDEAADLKASLTAAAPDDVMFNAAADAAKGLIGIYGLAQSASALFGVENEELQKTLVKLQAAETALQSIEAIRQVFKKENAVLQAREIVLQRVAILNTQLETATQSKNIIIKYAAIVAQKALNAVMSANPYIITALALAALATGLLSFTTASGTATKSQKEFNEALDQGAKRRAEILDGLQAEGEKNLNTLKSQFAAEKEIRNAKIENLRLQEEQAKQENDQNQKNYSALYALNRRKRRLDEDEVEEEKKALELKNAANRTYLSIKNQLNAAELEDVRATKEEEIKILQDEADIRKVLLNQRAKAQADIVGDDEKSYDERIKAARRFAQIQQELIATDLKKQLLDPTLKNEPKRRELLEKQAQAAINNARKDGVKQEQALNKERVEREKAAQFEIAKTAIEAQADAALRIADNEHASLEDRLSAQIKNFTLQKSIITAQKNFELSNTKLLDSERKAINDKARQEEIKAQVSFLDKVYAIQLQNLQRDAENTAAQSTKRRDNYLTQLNERFQAGEITEEEYRKKRLAAEERYAKDELNVLLDAIAEEIKLRKARGENVSKLEAAYAKARADAAQKDTDNQLKKEDEAFNKRIEKLNKYQEIATNVFASFGELVGASADTEIARIDEQIAALEKKKQLDIENANATITNEQDKAAAIATIEARANSQREALDRKRRQAELDKARFEKYSSIARIISDTAIAVVTTLGDKTIQPGFLRIPLAASIGLLGAAQLARVVATPLPKYAEGTEDHPGGKAVLGDGGKRELVVTPDGRLMMSDKIPQVFDLPAHSVVLPDADAVLNNARTGGYVNVPKASHRTEDMLNKALIKEYKTGTAQIVKAVKDKRELHVEGSHAGVMMLHKVSADYWTYINEQVNF